MAGAAYTFAAGYQAQALHPGAFVWADSLGSPFASTGNNEFLIRAQGGVGINTNAPGAALNVNGATIISPGIGSVSFINDANIVPGIQVNGGVVPGHLRFRNALEVWPNASGTASGYLDVRNTAGTQTIILDGSTGTITANTYNTSDRNAKEHLTPVDGEAVLEKVAGMPISEWNFKKGETSRHLGPMAQDFKAAFNLGMDDKHIATVDEGGVALAAIQGLDQELKEKDAEIRDLKERLEKLERLMDARESH